MNSWLRWAVVVAAAAVPLYLAAAAGGTAEQASDPVAAGSCSSSEGVSCEGDEQAGLFAGGIGRACRRVPREP